MREAFSAFAAYLLGLARLHLRSWLVRAELRCVGAAIFFNDLVCHLDSDENSAPATNGGPDETAT